MLGISLTWFAKSDVDVQKIVFDVEGDDIGDEIVEAPSSATVDQAVSIKDIVGSGKSILVGMVRNGQDEANNFLTTSISWLPCLYS